MGRGVMGIAPVPVRGYPQRTMRFIVTPPNETRPTLVVETCERITAERLLAFRSELFGMGCAHGLLFDDQEVAVLRDGFWTMSVDSVVEESRQRTDRVLVHATGTTLETRVGDWLSRMSSSWGDALPEDRDAAAALLYDVVPALSGSCVRAAA